MNQLEPMCKYLASAYNNSWFWCNKDRCKINKNICKDCKHFTA